MHTYLENLTANGLGKARREYVDGREYLVAPLTSIVPGVLSGSKGSLYYPPDEVGRNVGAWDGRPLTNGHPVDPVTGEHLSASDPGVWERQGLGRIHRSTFNGKLRHEAWFDVERTQQRAPEVLTSLRKGKPVEQSTGLYTDNEASPGIAPNGRPYDYVARNYRPDHLAVLSNQVGACSIQDGCGVLVNRGEPMTDKQRRQIIINALVEEYPELTVVNANPEGHNQYSGGAGGSEKVGGKHAVVAHTDDNKVNVHLHDSADAAGLQHSKFRTASNIKGIGRAKLPAKMTVKELHSATAAQYGRKGVKPEDVTVHNEAVTNAQGRKTVTGQYTNGTPKAENVDEHVRRGWGPHEQESFESADDELHEDDASSQLVGTHVKDGRGDDMDAIVEKGTQGTVGADDNDGLQTVQLTPTVVKSRKSVSPQVVVTGNIDIGALTMDPHIASKQAASASLHSDHDAATGIGQKAIKASKAGNSEKASGFHGQAADMHQEAATDARKKGDQMGADVHDQAAAMHSRAASMHDAACTNRLTTNDFDALPEDAKKAAFADMASGGGGKVSKEAHGASKTAEHTGKASDHKAAASAHREAAEHHRDEGNSELAAAHSAAAKAHSRKAKGTNNQGIPMTRQQAIKLLTANCGCQGDRAAINALSDEALLRLARNAKDDSSNADATGGGTDQAGGEDDDEDQPSNIAPALKTGPKVGDRGKKPILSENAEQYFERTNAPQSVRNAVKAAMEVEGREKVQIVRTLTANVDRQRVLMNESLPQLRERLAMAQEFVQNHGFQMRQQVTDNEATLDVPSFAGAGGGNNEGVQNAADDDILTLPTMNSLWTADNENVSPALLKMRQQA